MSNRRFEMYQYRQIIFQMRHGQSDRAISKLKLAGRDKCCQIRQISIKRGWLNVNAPLPEDLVLREVFKTERKKSHSLTMPYADEIETWHQQNINGATIYRALIRKHGFAGSYDSVKRYLGHLKLKIAKLSASMILSFEPAEAAQVDFGKGPDIIDQLTGEAHKTWIFVMTLCFSRHQYAEIILNQQVETWLGCHKRAFEFLGGIPKKIIIDNAKCAITKACYYDPTVQRSYNEFAEGCGFIISPCPPYEPKKKGIVESGVKYVKNSFVPLRMFNSIDDANTQLHEWILQEAGLRKHGTTFEKPIRLFNEIEQHLLNPLPAQPVEFADWTQVKVHQDCHVNYRNCRYSAPYQHIKETIWLRASETSVRLYDNNELVGIHPRLFKPGDRSTEKGHFPPKAKYYLTRDNAWCLDASKKIGSDCYQLMQILLNDPTLDRRRAMQGIINLSERFSNEQVNAACHRALFFNSPKYKTIKSILEQGIENKFEELAVVPDKIFENAYINGKFCRKFELRNSQ